MLKVYFLLAFIWFDDVLKEVFSFSFYLCNYLGSKLSLLMRLFVIMIKKIDTMIRKRECKPFLFFFRGHLWSILGITCDRGSFAVHFGDHLRLGILD